MNKLKHTLYGLFALLALPLLATGCSDDDTPVSPIPEKLVTAVDIPQMLSAYHGQTITLKGRGFEVGDLLGFISEVDPVSAAETQTRTMPVTAVTDITCSFVLDEALVTGSYDIVLTRGKKTQQLGTTSIKITPSMEVPDKSGATIKGVVHNDGKPLPGVRVTDGVLFTTTDADGFYWLESDKYNGYVFVIIPSGYEPYAFDAIPQFWSTLSMDADNCERHDFDLRKVDNDNHVLIVTADLHMANRNNDLTQYETLIYPDIYNTVQENSGKKVYSIALGDMSWDAYWYDMATQYAIPQYKSLVKNFPAMIFHAMGNHDNDPYCTDDFEAEKPYRTYLGPTYYSFNLGKVHYVILDNIDYVNKGGGPGTIGERNYNASITRMQLDWLAEDLKTVDKNTPVVIGMHIPMYKLGMLGSNVYATQNFDISGLTSLLDGYKEVHCISGHTHINRAVGNALTKNNIFEHNIAGLCATWWWTGRLSNNHICRDGSQGGYMVFDVNGTDMDWRFKAAGKASDKQFRTYDVNVVKNYFATNSHARTFLKAYPTRESYGSFDANSVLINVWNWDETWSIRVMDGSTELPVTQVNCEDPLHTLSYDIPRTVANGSTTSSFVTIRTTHMFRVTSTSSNSPLTIEVTDGAGRKYTETMTRPKEFKLSME